jgi:hypothetical protein
VTAEGARVTVEGAGRPACFSAIAAIEGWIAGQGQRAGTRLRRAMGSYQRRLSLQRSDAGGRVQRSTASYQLPHTLGASAGGLCECSVPGLDEDRSR